MNESAEIDAARQASQQRGLRYARAAGYGGALALLIWTPLNLIRWQGAGPAALLTWESVFFPVYALLILAPGARLPQRLWRWYFPALLVGSAAFVFTMVIDLMFLALLAGETGGKIPPPAFQSGLLFSCLLQVPTILFQRRPELLD